MRRRLAFVGLTLALCGAGAGAQADGRAMIAQAVVAPPEASAAALATWDGASYDSFSDFLAALQAGRYTGLVFKRMSADLREGHIAVLVPVLERYFAGRKAIHGLADPLIRDGLFLTGVEQDLRAGIAHADASTDLSVPEFTVAAVIERAKRIVRQTYGLAGGPDTPARNRVTPPEGVAGEPPPEPTRRAENTGLLHDVLDFARQPHLQFLVGGVGVTQMARLVGEALKIARRDNYIVDVATVAAFIDRLIEAELIAPDDRVNGIEQAMIAVGLRQAEPPQEAATGIVREPAPVEPPPELEPSPPAEAELEPSAPVEAETDPVDEPDSVPPAVEPAPSPAPGPPQSAPRRTTVIAKRPPAPRVPPAPPTEEADAASGPVVTFEAGMGATLPAGDGDLSGLAGKVERAPGIAGRFGLALTWLEALGSAHLSLGLYGVVGQTKSDRLVDRGGPPSLDTRGTVNYAGLLPFMSVEFPVMEGVNMRLGGGLGVAQQDVSVVDAGVELVDADGTSLIAQIGGGLRVALTPCMDVGVDVLATYLDDVSGRTNLGAPVRFGGSWDVAAYLGLRVALAGPGGSGAGLFLRDTDGGTPCF